MGRKTLWADPHRHELASFLALLALLGSAGCGTVQMVTKATSDVPSAGRFPHERLGLVLDKVVSPDGLVDYATLQLQEPLLEEYLAELARVSPESHAHLFPTEDDRLAYWINAENACALRDVLRWQRPTHLSPIAHRFDAETYFVVGGKKLSLNDMTNLMRQRFADPRIHFVLVRGRRGGPPLAKEPFDAATLQLRLGRAAQAFVQDERFVEWNSPSTDIRLNKVFFDFRSDFEAEMPSTVSGDTRLIMAINHWRDPARKLVASIVVPIPFDDRLNDVANE
jgi:Protein of unknown function, DUF547